MKESVLLILAVVLFFPHQALCAGINAENAEETPAGIRLVFDNQEVVVRLFANPASKDFLSLLPLQAEFEDFAGKEKITYLPRKLDTSRSPTAQDAEGDFTYFAPWGNLAVFYRGFGNSGQVYVLGRIESGKEKLAAQRGSFTARIERIE